MVVCKFFMQGVCRYGSNCRFEHVLYDAPPQGSSMLLQPQKTTNPPKANVDTATLVRSVQTDMLNTEKGGQWLLSSYAPFKEKPLFEGFEDKSFEEIRLGFYEANKNGKVEEYKQELQILLQNTMAKIRALQNPTQNIVKVLENIYNTPIGNKSNVFEQKLPTNPSIFGSSKPTSNSVFGGTANQQSFGNNVFASINTNMAAKPSSGSIFGSVPSGPTNTIFGSTPSSQHNSPFGGSFGATTNQSVFQTTTNQVPQNAAITSNSPFGQANSVFPKNASPFTAQQPQTGSIFQQNTQNAQQQFGGQMQTNSPFGQPPPFPNQNTNNPPKENPFSSQPNNPSNNPFGMQNTFVGVQTAPSGNSPFATSAATNSPFAGQNIFGSQPQPVQQPQPAAQFGAQNNSNIFGGGQGNNVMKNNVDPAFYSKPEDLQEEDLKSFQSDSFQMGKIPCVPPTQQLCF